MSPQVKKVGQSDFPNPNPNSAYYNPSLKSYDVTAHTPIIWTKRQPSHVKCKVAQNKIRKHPSGKWTGFKRKWSGKINDWKNLAKHVKIVI
jgi:hypothetical protein